MRIRAAGELAICGAALVLAVPAQAAPRIARACAGVTRLEERIARHRELLKRLPPPSSAETPDDRLCRAIGETSKAAVQPRDRIFFEDNCSCASSCARTGTPAHAMSVKLSLDIAEERLAFGRQECARATAARARRERAEREAQKALEREARERDAERERGDREWAAWRAANPAWVARMASARNAFVGCLEDATRHDCRGNADAFWAVCGEAPDRERARAFCDAEYNKRRK